ncbi:transcription factor TFIIIB component B'' isoform X1 [Apis mellifera caucasica]|uniref:Transcription factor TFIIIB component B'' isoform X1 n=2 Tax=Apis mellifera TaxID=7460 RepID=A0A7M7MPP8_APIME|nr:transcription factor TFIIIB component B'' isoform X1 [Apis mellifera]XP_026299086.1 transcription factor TFIIIB component B'' isoform X1 [Apis mellifera]KAG6801632.1 transcription factor TFIIIB component B'' isoform X1 [Apis mellifera caucasica]KAG9430311.1 transcription factor TFIIIB component B'' isoform X1 [Apis mellifera carnica]|eukprot:XP_026299085.1 transcription factor TFIIIB component B'' isoform X1 [Apis mellifera]
MKRARIKAIVTVPTRRKATQDISDTEIINTFENNDKNKNISDDSLQSSENILHENQEQENLENTKKIIQIQEIEEQVPNEQFPTEQCNEYKSDSMQNSKEEIVNIQSSEILNITQITSPIKSTQNRSGFMKPTPKFDNNSRVRRNSIQGSGASTSESEDDSRRLPCSITNHTKNDLVQLSYNTKDAVTNNIKNNLITTKLGQKRRILVSESTRKLAEARREFHLKHENKTPDRSKLTMYDLIYYNPVTNPMKKSNESTTRKMLEYQSEEFQEEENEDDPSSAMPVPQVKVGPNGQLIIDEQSLVIEQTNAKKGRKVLAKEAIIDDDNSGSGFYKKRQKSKEWSERETLKFYKALNTIGTDFLLMQSLFPHRTRQEMKLKFKKEEKVNRHLVEKALAYHQEFDTEMLEKSLATFENSEKEYLHIQEKRKQKTKSKKNSKSTRRRRIVASSIAEMDASDNEEEKEDDFGLDSIMSKENTHLNDECQQTSNKMNKKMYKRTRDERKLLIKEDDVESLSSCNDVDSDTEIYRVRPTRSGRLPKVKRLQGPDINTLDNERLNCSSNDEITISSEDNAKVTENLIFDNINLNSEIHHIDPIKTVIPSIGNVEPGSLVILSKESLEEPGKSVLQVYMVSSDVNT